MNRIKDWGSGRRWMGVVVVFMSMITLVAMVRPATVVAQAVRDDPAAAVTDTYEPNNTKGAATLIYPSELWDVLYDVTIDPRSDQDFYAFNAVAGDFISIRVWLYDETMPPLDLTLFGGEKCAIQLVRGPVIALVAPTTGRYCIRVRSTAYPDVGNPDYTYSLTLSLRDRFEPNNTLATAAPIRYGETVEATMMYGDFADHYIFQGKAGDRVVAGMRSTGYGPSVHILDAQGVALSIEWEDQSVHTFATLPADGMYYVLLQNENYEGYATDCAYNLVLDKATLVSTAVGGRIGTLRFDNDDILLHLEEADRWEVLLDPDRVGIVANVSSFGFLRREYKGSNVLISLQYPQQLCTQYWGCEDGTGLVDITPHDVLNNFYLKGGYHLLFDGSDVGLTTAGEKIDALAVAPDGRLLLSTVDSGNVPGVGSFRDEDVLAFTPTQWGADTTGTWELYFDGSTIPGLAVEDVAGIDVGLGGILYLSLLDSFTVGGIKCGPTCIIAVYPDGRVEKAWDGRDFGFFSKLDAFDFAGNATLIQP